MTDFAELLRVLSEKRVSFILVGGVAAVAHGSARFTQDVDVVYQRSSENIDRLVESLREHQPYLRGAPPGLPFQFDAQTVLRGMNFTLTTRLGDLDLFGEIVGGGSYEDLIEHTFSLNAFGIRCCCLDIETLIRVKRAAGRPKDLEAIAELEALLQDRLGESDRGD